jgi:hypothetical protein
VAGILKSVTSVSIAERMHIDQGDHNLSEKIVCGRSLCMNMLPCKFKFEINPTLATGNQDDGF